MRTTVGKRRVVVTGIGAVSPNGVGRENFWKATRCGQSGIRRITRFDPSGHQVQIAGEVTGSTSWPLWTAGNVSMFRARFLWQLPLRRKLLPMLVWNLRGCRANSCAKSEF